ncbi:MULTISPECIES: hypothetical protein [unclassified Arsukibacterium]|uniref:ORC-CDC6 family AAA ATPase n=1 Tax=unclassified Arsukibacterium TaxID=2635278 RepID=UPI000C6AB59B|nr:MULTISPECIES: hypothetical protein [unclassified Arsukibacterium]MAA95718.1 hypothetical protein [Rheinheimera sp.]MBM35351.1 hypothetical protein [Rheinheimera sp.]|tara:strand:+ start:156415 stop:158103 length:1689 start_codon:yes stop_codon:yes gene_type:complete
MEKVFRSRPFKVRNADEYDVSNILSLFVNPINGLATPFDYENSIIKGRMGSGKTMYLRANHAYYLSALVPSLIAKTDELILPVFIRLNDFQHIKEPSEIYRAIIIKVIEELTSIYLHLEDMKHLAAIQSGIQQIPENMLGAQKLATSLKQLAQLGSDEYIERVSTELGFKGGVKPKFFELSADWRNSSLTELKRKPNPGIKDIEECYKNLLEGQEGKLLLLIDEAGSLDKNFFKNGEDTCLFEVLMNQFRTASFIRTKIAVYPNSFSDMLTETRYGDSVILEDDIFNDQGYSRFRSRTIEMMSNYLNPNSYEDTEVLASDVFNITNKSDDPVEQIIFASNGNMRRMMQLLDLTMDAAYSENNCAVKIEKRHAKSALINHANKSESEFNHQDLELLHSLVTVCKARGAFKFQFPNVPLYKYTNKSQEYNLINVVQLGSGRRPTTYAFDYSYAVAKEIPTHRMADSEKICHDRSVVEGRWLTRSATISDELIQHAALPGKQEGNVEYIKGECGFITSDGNEEYFFACSDVIQTDKSKLVVIGKRVRFYPSKLGDAKMAILIEVL